MNKKSRTQSVKLLSIGNSKAVRLPKFILRKYGFLDRLLLERTEHGILLRRINDAKLSWEETYKEMAQKHEDWLDFEDAISDGL